MLFIALFWIAIFLVVMRVLTWVARRHPRGRNAAAFVVETGAAFAIWEALADVGVLASGSIPSPAGLVARAILFGCIGAAAHFFASNTATSPHVLYPPFIVIGVAVLAWIWMPYLKWTIGIGMLTIGGAVGWAKYRSIRSRAASGAAHEVAQA